MKYLILLSLFISNLALAKSAKDIHSAVIEGAKADLEKDHAQDFKVKPSRMRAPASVEVHQNFYEESILEQKEKQHGSKKW